MKIFKVYNEKIECLILAKDKTEAEAKFTEMYYPTVLDDDLPNLNIDVEVLVDNLNLSTVIQTNWL